MIRVRSALFATIGSLTATALVSSTARGGGECAPQWVSLSQGPIAIEGRPDESMLTVGENSRFGPAVFMLGYFSMTPESPRTLRLARWDDSGWSLMPIAANGAHAYSMALHGQGESEAVYFGGDFSAGSGGPFGNVAKWDGADFSLIPDSLLSGAGSYLGVLAVTSYSHEGQELLVVGGGFSAIGVTPASNIAAWDGDTWIELGGGLGGPDDAVLALAAFDDGSGPAVYASGWFTQQDGKQRSRIARWKGESWEHIGYDLGSHARDFVIVEPGGVLEPGLYAGGEFIVDGDSQQRNVARWNGSGWDAVGSMPGGYVYNIEVMDDGGGATLFASGRIWLDESTQDTDFLVKWNGDRWISMGADAGSIGSGHFLGVFPGSPAAPSILFVRGDFNDSPSGDAHFAAWQGCTAVPCSGDANGDNIVNFTDLNAILADFGAADAGLPGDLNGDGAVDFADLNLVLSNFGQGC